MNIIKVLSHIQWGAEEEVLLKIYRALVLSRLDYGCIVYNSASKSALKSLESVQNTALRLCLSAYRSSPSESLYIEAHDPPLWLRRRHLLLRYASRVSTDMNNPVSDLIASKIDTVEMSATYRSAFHQLKNYLPDIDVRKTSPTPISTIPPWCKRIPQKNLSLLKFNGEEYTPNFLKTCFAKLISSKHFDRILFTDCSKSKDGVASAVTSEDEELVINRLPPLCSVFSGELFAILQAVRAIKTGERVAICTDSLASVHAISKTYAKHPLVHSIHEHYNGIAASGAELTLIWVPSHKGIKGNEKADQAAKRVYSSSDHLPEEFQYEIDVRSYIKEYIKKIWRSHWNGIATKLREVHPTVSPAKFCCTSRRDLAILRRLRIGHTALTHSYILNSENPPTCNDCHVLLSVKHILTECKCYEAQRKLHNLQDFKELLSNPNHFQNLIDFLKNTGLYSRI